MNWRDPAHVTLAYLNMAWTHRAGSVMVRGSRDLEQAGHGKERQAGIHHWPPRRARLAIWRDLNAGGSTPPCNSKVTLNTFCQRALED